MAQSLQANELCTCRGSRNEDMFLAFSRNRSFREIMSLQSGQGDNDHYLQYRETLILIAHHHRTSSCVNVTLQDKHDTAGIVIQIKGLRQLDAETPLFEVQYMYNTKYVVLTTLAIGHTIMLALESAHVYVIHTANLLMKEYIHFHVSYPLSWHIPPIS